jgi:hypothetical protein
LPSTVSDYYLQTKSALLGAKARIVAVRDQRKRVGGAGRINVITVAEGLCCLLGLAESVTHVSGRLLCMSLQLIATGDGGLMTEFMVSASLKHHHVPTVSVREAGC